MLTVLVADDSRVVRERLAAHLTELEGVALVGQAAGGREALELLAAHSPDVLVLDLGMAEVDGFAVLNAAKAQRPAPVVIVLTNYAYAQYRAKALAEGADYFLDKSHEFAAVTEILGDLASGRSPLRRHGAAARQGQAGNSAETAPHRRRLSGVLLQSISDVVLVADETGSIVHVSPSVKTVLGYEPDEVLGAGWWELTRPDPAVREAAREQMARRARGDEPLPTEPYHTEVCHKSGEPRWIEWHDAPGPDGTIVGVGHDVTDRRRTQAILELLTEGTNTQTGDDFFSAIVVNLTKALGVEYALVGELIGAAQDRVRTIAVAERGTITDGVEYELAGTPCANVAGRRTCSYPRDVQASFPQDVLLRKLAAESYVGTPLFDTAGKPLGMLAVLDRQPLADEGLARTALEFAAARAAAELERRQADQALRASETKFELAFLASPSPMAIISYPDGHWVEVNQSFVRAFGYLRDDAKGRTAGEMGLWHSPEDRNRVVQALQRDGAIADMEIAFVTRDGRTRIGVLSARLVELEGRPCVLAVLADVTDRKRAEEALRRNERRFRHLVDNTWDVFLLVNADGVIEWGGESVTRVMGYTPEEFVGRPIYEFVHPEDSETLLARFRAVLQEAGRTLAAEVRGRHRDGSWRWLEVAGTNLLADPDVGAVVGTLRDVTARKVAEQGLVASEERFRTVADTLDEAVWDLDMTTGRVWWGDGLRRLFGHESTETETSVAFWQANVHPDDRERVLAETWAAIDRGDREWTVEFRFRRRDGSYAFVRDRATVLRAAHGRPVRMVGAMVDITEQRRAEQALRANEERFRFIAKATNEALWDQDLVTGESWWGEGFDRFFGYAPGELPATYESWSSRIHPEDRERVLKGTRSVIEEGGTEWVGEYRFRRKDGTYATVYDRALVIRDREGQPIRMLGAMLDLTERKRAEAALRASEARFAKAFSANPSPMAIMTLDDGLFVEVNESFVKTFAYSREELLNRSVLEVGLWNDPGQRREIIDEVRKRGSVTNQELEFRTKSGELRVGLYSAERIELDGKPYLLALINDITERRALEAQLRQAQKLEAVGQVTSGIAHDFNNLLTVILSNADLIEAHLPPGAASLQSDVDDLKVAARRGAEMVRKLLTFSRRGALTLRPIRLSDLVCDSGAMLRRVIPEHIDLRLAVDQPVSAVRADAGAVEQILLNLATNARDAMGEGGVLTISVTETDVDAARIEMYGLEATGSYVCVAVTDTGTGMDVETQAKIFEPFFTTKPPGEGSGLGMAMIYGLVKQHGGFVEVESTTNQGTTVRVFLPATDEKPVDVRAERTAAIRGGSETVLVVEDFEVIRRAARRALERHGYRVLVASDGAEALQILLNAEEQVDLVITDLVMPKVSGQRLYQAARRAGVDVRFLFTSGYGREDGTDEPIQLDSDVPFLRKPWTVPELLSTVRELLDRP